MEDCHNGTKGSLKLTVIWWLLQIETQNKAIIAFYQMSL